YLRVRDDERPGCDTGLSSQTILEPNCVLLTIFGPRRSRFGVPCVQKISSARAGRFRFPVHRAPRQHNKRCISPSAIVAVAATGTAHAAGVCLVTDGDTLGPFYRPNAKNTTKMVDASTEGERILLTGTVLRPDCQTPVAGATVDFWHCDHTGAYD